MADHLEDGDVTEDPLLSHPSFAVSNDDEVVVVVVVVVKDDTVVGHVSEGEEEVDNEKHEWSTLVMTSLSSASNALTSSDNTAAEKFPSAS